MADSIISAVVSTILENLGSAAYKKLMSAKDFDSHVERLLELKTTVEATLTDAALLESCSDAQQNVLDKISNALVDLDDFLDEQAIKADLKEVMRGNKLIKSVRSFFSESNQLVSRLIDAQRLKVILEKFDRIARDHANFGSLVISSSIPSVNQNQRWSIQAASSPILNGLVIGRDTDRDIIVSMQSEDSIATEALSVVSVVGIGGIGKTTLAWYVYRDERVERCFDEKFWVEAGPNFDFRKVLEKIIGCVTGELLPSNLCGMDQLYQHFRRAIGGKKFLLVLDNIWDHSHLRDNWVGMKSLLEENGASGSKVLITTRDKKVGEIMESNDLYMLEDLIEEDSWLLFQKIAFTQWQEPGVKAIGKKIAGMCPNVPLVIRSIGGILAGKNKVWEWEAFRDVQLLNFASYGRDIMRTLKLSYDHLDPKLKLCVTYCTLFPTREEFFNDRMIRFWIALDYVEPKYRNQSLEEVGEEYMNILLNSGFFQLTQVWNQFGFGYGYTMHDVMYELVFSLAGSKYKMADSNTDEFDRRVRHVSLDWDVRNGSSWEVSSLFKIKHLQSFIVGGSLIARGKLYNMSICFKSISKLKWLKVLDLHGPSIKGLPASVGELISLRFLDLSFTEIARLPHSITRLVNLISLHLHGCDQLEELPNMTKFVNLRHLHLSGCNRLSHMPIGLGNLINLRELDLFIVSEEIESKGHVMGKLADLNRLNNISGHLWIKVCRQSKDIVSSEFSAANLKMKENLEELSIQFENISKDDERVLECLKPPPELQFLRLWDYGGERLPLWMMQAEIYLPNLVEIYIQKCKACRYFCSLGRLPQLRRLSLMWLDEVEYMEDKSSNSYNNTDLFPHLESLQLFGMPKLKGWWRMSSRDSRELLQVEQYLVNWKPAFPKLNKLAVDSAESAIAIVKQYLPFTSLEDLYIEGPYTQPLAQQRQPLTLKCCFPNLRRLSISCSHGNVIPEAIRALSFLKHLHMQYCNEMNAIPEWIDTLTSLEFLHFSYCPKLELLPYQFRNLSNLKEFSVENCPILSEKCKKPNGEYWPLIQHVPNLWIY